jgi:hypothetical protein
MFSIRDYFDDDLQNIQDVLDASFEQYSNEINSSYNSYTEDSSYGYMFNDEDDNHNDSNKYYGNKGTKDKKLDKENSKIKNLFDNYYCNQDDCLICTNHSKLIKCGRCSGEYCIECFKKIYFKGDCAYCNIRIVLDDVIKENVILKENKLKEEEEKILNENKKKYTNKNKTKTNAKTENNIYKINNNLKNNLIMSHFKSSSV